MTLEQTVFTRVRLRLIPFMFLLYLVNYLDRVNIGFAALQMNKDLGFGPEVYGFGAGIFFWGYLLFEIPSNLLMDRVGARKWIARIMITWGIVSTGMMFMRDDVLHAALSAGHRRSRIFSGDDSVPHVLVPGVGAREGGGAVHDRERDCRRHRRTDLRRAVADGRDVRPARLAMAVPARRHPLHHARRRRLDLSDRSAGAGGLADRRAA
jgi:hypothetical protein